MGALRRYKTAVIALICLHFVTACAQDRYLSDHCLLDSPARPNSEAWEAADRQFKEWIVAHNEAGAELCGWEP